jgi:hypothetical protein
MSFVASLPAQQRADQNNRVVVAPGRWSPRWLILLLVCVGQFMVVLDSSSWVHTKPEQALY